MKKIETIWHEILISAVNERKYQHTQQNLARQFGYSTSTVNLALKIPNQIGAVRITSKFFVLESFDKLLFLWATLRNLDKDIIYKTYQNLPVAEIESLLPDKAVYACYSAARKILPEPPADYAKVYFYIDKSFLEIARNRFPPSHDKEPNIFILEKPDYIKNNIYNTDIVQTFVDLWNCRDWYSHDFTKTLKEKIDELLS